MATREVLTRRRRPGAADVGVGGVVAGVVGAAVVLRRRGRPDGRARLDPDTTYTVGRGANADFCFDDDGVSRVHAHLKRDVDGDGGAWVIVDARSANGTFVARASRAFADARMIREAAVVGVGDTVFLGDAHASIELVDVARAEPALDRGLDDDDRVASERGRRYLRDLAKAAKAQGAVVLLIGASGTGKTWAARRIHDESGRSGAFISLNAAALPHDPAQLRSVLLGHTRGAFTGADRDVEGAFFAADNGSLFLDEIDSLEPPAQAFLLTLLEQSGDLAPLGARAATTTDAERVDVRVVAATKTSLRDAKLRPDLAFRLADGVIVEIPSLRERRDDIAGLVSAIVAELRREDGAAAAFSADAVDACRSADWPGEVRQLRGVVRLLAREALAEGRDVVAGDVTARLDVVARALGTAARPIDTSKTAVSDEAKDDAKKKPRALTKEDVQRALVDEDGNIQRAAERLGIARNTIIAKMDAFGIARPASRSSRR